jgi:N-acetylglucosamine kinase-like BadF-type ATPase
MILIASSEIALDQLETISGTKSNFYRQDVKGALNKAIKVLAPYVEEFLDFHNNPDDKAEKGYYAVATMIETFVEALAESDGKGLMTLGSIMSSYRKGEFKFTDEKEYNSINQEPDGNN